MILGHSERLDAPQRKTGIAFMFVAGCGVRTRSPVFPKHIVCYECVSQGMKFIELSLYLSCSLLFSFWDCCFWQYT